MDQNQHPDSPVPHNPQDDVQSLRDRVRQLEEELARSGRKLDVALESHQLVTVGRMVASGLGGSAVPALCEAQMTSLGAVCIPLDNPPIEKCIGVIHPGHTQLSKAAHALLETLKDFYQPGQGARNTCGEA